MLTSILRRRKTHSNSTWSAVIISCFKATHIIKEPMRTQWKKSLSIGLLRVRCSFLTLTWQKLPTHRLAGSLVVPSGRQVSWKIYAMTKMVSTSLTFMLTFCVDSDNGDIDPAEIYEGIISTSMILTGSLQMEPWPVWQKEQKKHYVVFFTS